ncbi:hypothetical protein HZS_8108, partial [Henneguya salminicola]
MSHFIKSRILSIKGCVLLIYYMMLWAVMIVFYSIISLCQSANRFFNEPWAVHYETFDQSAEYPDTVNQDEIPIKEKGEIDPSSLFGYEMVRGDPNYPIVMSAPRSRLKSGLRFGQMFRCKFEKPSPKCEIFDSLPFDIS